MGWIRIDVGSKNLFMQCPHFCLDQVLGNSARRVLLFSTSLLQVHLQLCEKLRVFFPQDYPSWVLGQASALEGYPSCSPNSDHPNPLPPEICWDLVLSLTLSTWILTSLWGSSKLSYPVYFKALESKTLGFLSHEANQFQSIWPAQGFQTANITCKMKDYAAFLLPVSF